MAERKKFRRVRQIVIGLACVLACLVITAIVLIHVFDNGISAFGENSCPETSPKEVEDFAHFKLPPSARNLISDCSGMQGIVANAKFEMSPTDLNAFIASTLIDKPLSTNSGMPDTGELFGFDEKAVKSYLYGKYDHPAPNGGVYEDILVDTTNPTTYVVYVNYSAG